MSEEKKQDIAMMFDELKNLSRDDLMKTYGFAIGLSSKTENTNSGEKPVD